MTLLEHSAFAVNICLQFTPPLSILTLGKLIHNL